MGASTSISAGLAAPERPTAPAVVPVPVIDVRGVTKRFGRKTALDDVSLSVGAGEIHALLGPNGAGKTTLLRILGGLVTPDAGTARLRGDEPRRARGLLGLVPAGDRSFYLRISAVENLVFFGRLHGLTRREALARAHDALASVGLEGEARTRAALLSKGMQRRLTLARALLPEPAILLVDEATHDLDPPGARRIRTLVADAAAARSMAVVWTTQRLEEITGLARRVTLLDRGQVRFCGSVDDLIAHSVVRRYVLTMPTGHDRDHAVARACAAVAGSGSVAAVPAEDDRYVLDLADEAVLGEALAALTAAGFAVVACRPDRSEIEEAFVALTRREAP